jgi:hypothetical protein
LQITSGSIIDGVAADDTSMVPSRNSHQQWEKSTKLTYPIGLPKGLIKVIPVSIDIDFSIDRHPIFLYRRFVWPDTKRKFIKKTEEKMENAIDPGLLALMDKGKGKGTDQSTLILLLLLLGGRRGFLGGDYDGAGIRSNATQADVASQTQWTSSQFANVMRDLSDIRNSGDVSALNITNSIQQAQNILSQGHAQIERAICDCCCKLGVSIKDVERAVEVGNCNTVNAVERTGLATINAIEKCCCENRLAISEQTNTLANAICTEGQKTRALITDNRMQDLQQTLTDCKLNLSNTQQTIEINKAIQEACGCNPHPHRRSAE